ncbi:MFS transporter- MCP family- solute carrier family 16 (monocarboxylic acid transporters)- member 10 [Apiospora rasikravindrae]|uniref:MFS transporter- MCP family- solute carrier family 16 (Monocarboxylic acid transporters)- member 10 n=1 Tax=Apiospora rasikravindrae TaxID=990691 RepID=A0ABR1T029_9PEZI
MASPNDNTAKGTGGNVVLSSSEAAQSAPGSSNTEMGKLRPPTQPNATSPSPTPPPPNGGLVAWLQVVGSWCLMLNCWGIINTYGVFQTYYQTKLLTDRTPSSIAWIGSIQAFLLLFVGALTGPLYDYGYFHHLIAVGSFLMVFGMMMVSLCTQYWQLVLAQGIVVGLGGGCLFVPSIAILPTYFSTRMAFTIGIAGSGSGIGGIIYPIVFQELEDNLGFAWATRVIAFVMIATLSVPLAVMRPRLTPSAVRKLFDFAAWTERPYSFFAFGGFFGFIGMYLPMFYVSVFAMQHGTSPRLAFYLLPILNAGSIFGRIFPNYAADKTGPLNIFIPTCFALALVSFAWMAIYDTAGLIVFTIIYGFFSGTFLTLPFSTVVTLSPHMGVVGVRMGMACAIGSLGLLVGTPLAGAILTHGGWHALQAFGGVTLLIATVAMSASRISKVGWHLTAKA